MPNGFHRVLAYALLGLGLTQLGSLRTAQADDFPQRQIQIIVPVAPGGGSDILARLVGDKLAGILKQSVVIDNKPGGGHVVGTSIGAKAAPDGHTLTMVGMPHVVNPLLHSNLSYDAIKDFKPVVLLAQVPIVLVVHSSSPYKTVQDLVEDARRKPGEIAFASTSMNGSGHLAGELLKLQSKIDLTHIPYRGSSAALQDVVPGRVPVMFDALVTAEPHIRSGSLRPLAVTTRGRAAQFPDVPTMVESGYKDFSVSGWLGFLVPSGTPDSSVDRLNQAVNQALQDKDVQATLVKQGWEVLPVGPTKQAFAKFLADEQTKWTGVASAAKLKAN